MIESDISSQHLFDREEGEGRRDGWREDGWREGKRVEERGRNRRAQSLGKKGKGEEKEGVRHTHLLPL